MRKTKRAARRFPAGGAFVVLDQLSG